MHLTVLILGIMLTEHQRQTTAFLTDEWLKLHQIRNQ